MRKKTIFTAIILLIFCLVVYTLTLSFPLKAAIIPKLMVYILSTCCILILIKNIYVKRNDDEEPFQDVDWKKWLISICIWLIYIWLIPRMGFWIASGLFIVIITSYLEMDSFNLKEFKLPLIFGIAFTLGCYLIFAKLFGMYMP